MEDYDALCKKTKLYTQFQKLQQITNISNVQSYKNYLYQINAM